MGKVVVIGAGGVSTVAVKKMAMDSDALPVGQTKRKCEGIAVEDLEL
ncbi:MAG: hypothetical protein LBG28_16440 [Tannerella sp.]|jgi:saccharopine dehydrogenase (NAD+, L-lysine-forming)|nr:hypothetical protein [Tannerella sp.]